MAKLFTNQTVDAETAWTAWTNDIVVGVTDGSVFDGATLTCQVTEDGGTTFATVRFSFIAPDGGILRLDTGKQFRFALKNSGPNTDITLFV